MLHLVIVAATLWLCPGEVYTNEQGEGCRPVQNSGKEGFSRVPELRPTRSQWNRRRRRNPDRSNGRAAKRLPRRCVRSTRSTSSWNSRHRADSSIPRRNKWIGGKHFAGCSKALRRLFVRRRLAYTGAEKRPRAHGEPKFLVCQVPLSSGYPRLSPVALFLYTITRLKLLDLP